MNRPTGLPVMALGVLQCLVAEPIAADAAERATPAGKPNIIVILADDLGYADLGCQGCKDIPTPNIDTLARNGIRFTDGYVASPYCSPSRAALMTGRYPQRFGHEFNTPGRRQDVGLPLTEVTLADRFKAAGYATGIVGKWHLGAGARLNPLRRGFDEFFGFAHEGHFYVGPSYKGDYTSSLREKEPEYDKLNPILRGTRPVEEKEYLTEAFTREALAFIDRHKSHPFFLYLPYNAVHSPMQALPKYLDRFRAIANKKRRVFAAMLAALDDGVGAVLKELRDQKLEENTLIVFLSDNGGPTAELTSSNLPLRGFKGEVLEGGIRIPFLVQWKGHLPAGKVYRQPISSLDILPTALAAARIKLPTDAKIDGVNLLPYLTGKDPGPPHEFLFWRLGAQLAARKGRWKLVQIGNRPPELFDLAADIGEKNNLARQKPDVLKELEAALQQWNGRLAQPLWGGAPTRRPQLSATPVERIKVARDFKVDLLYSVPKDRQGSWVSMCVDPRGRLIVSDQYGPLYRITPPALGGKAEDTKIEKIDLPIGQAQGLLWAFDSLYVVVNIDEDVKGAKYATGLYRVRSTRGDDRLDEVKLLRKIDGAGEHGPHAVLLAPDGKSLYVVCGDATKMTKLSGSRVPRLWGEDHLLPRMPDGMGFMRDVLGPGGCIYRVDPEGKSWELWSTGFRNPYDAAFNRNGDLFTYDADMELDMNTPWYRPTRICLAVSGSEFGWRNGAGKWPPHYPDSWPPVLDIGPGSPTGMTFGYGAKFPASYQEALFMCDWSYGKLYAVHLTPDGSAYKGEAEEFLSGVPLPLTDIVVNPRDGAMYFTIGGRKVQSGLYRLTYTGKESTPPDPDDRGADARALRRKLEAFHGRHDPRAIDVAWPYLSHADRYIRSAARVAIEHQDPRLWQERALGERNPSAALQALLALVRVRSTDPFHRKASTPPVDKPLKRRLLEALGRFDWKKLDDRERLDLLRVYGILFVRMGAPDEAVRKQVIDRLDAHYPAKDRLLNAELCQMLVYLEAPGVAGRTLRLLAEAPTQEERLEYAKSLRMLKTGWTREQRKAYFTWFLKAAGFQGGGSVTNFVKNIKSDAMATLTAQDRVALKSILEARPETVTTLFPAKPRPFVKKWKVDDLMALVDKGLTGRSFDRGRALFGAARCFSCHRFANEGGALGPDLTGIAGRYSTRDLLEKITTPSKAISDQYAASNITTTDGKVITGRIVNLGEEILYVMTNLLEPSRLTRVDRRKVETIQASKVSMMPEGLLDTFQEDEIKDLIAYLLSRGDRKHKMFAAAQLPDQRRPAGDAELRYWLENMVWHHRFTSEEITAATGLNAREIRTALEKLGIRADNKPKRPADAPLLVLPYPGGRHPRIGFLDGAIRPQRETKISIFAPWDDASYAVVDVPESILSNLGRLYLAHTHAGAPTIWEKQGIKLEQLEWKRRPNGRLDIERKLPNGIVFGASVLPEKDGVRMELWLTNGTKKQLTGLLVKSCVLLRGLTGFEQQTNANKVFSGPYAACKSADGKRWVITAWEPFHVAWANPKCPCLHADPRLPDCAPGQTQRVHGWLSFYEGTDIEAEFKRLNKVRKVTR
jgi:putative heme-binding domain-containing protein